MPPNEKKIVTAKTLSLNKMMNSNIFHVKIPHVLTFLAFNAQIPYEKMIVRFFVGFVQFVLSVQANDRLYTDECQ